MRTIEHFGITVNWTRRLNGRGEITHWKGESECGRFCAAVKVSGSRWTGEAADIERRRHVRYESGDMTSACLHAAEQFRNFASL